MIEEKFYSKCLKESYHYLEDKGIHLGVGDKYLIRKLSQEYLALGLSKDFKQEEFIEASWNHSIKKGHTNREKFIILQSVSWASMFFKKFYFDIKD